ncbi:type I-C CRISPR-associated protein Cas8c/Csd1 [Streptomyces acidiscabies]|uniref:Type I-C CRISPR-associated protein Cas8c/Csd1 n=1 Tax=Streptomyces acidiscabies TaxID=42234 RepID=A0AAP6EMD8_9ACTN|nr:type I-C CRISPR-associated protein Cas8c/Csd1 [Streptomyces acidiscabies]MBP5941995.1 type I-C CRISPR-associated protein Cas8c/Csd1 [Streptomyces sp. LBUM 1476]MBZ3913468.1 type I-C CRISPR-associated protein Cas8c/Csd1 [Streptomyces acidiscabies]MDX2967206.1 type I-C CRISPR-associated protein Cas8c/Csd1 [Streptomyces acidiscabies]MDX3026072.1 type I-C CRISPR-associated protein Cas8c/Csd1 [Streptomyces acidiscabies]MDX3797052.1 type I-C CRISPR-associated protein Cas8c/Csd1 [Streptomyces acid
MLLQSLTEYANRAESDGKLPPAYYRDKKIQWVLRIAADGSFVALDNRRPPKGSKDKPLSLNTPYAYRAGITPPPYLLVDTAQYVLAVPKTDKDGTVSEAAVREAVRRQGEYTDLLLSWTQEAADDPYAQAVHAFVTGGGLTRIHRPDDMTSADNVALMGPNGTWLHDLPSAFSSWAATVRSRKSNGDARGWCLVCGEEGELLATIPESIKSGSIPTGGQARDSQLISVNAAAYGRDGMLQLVNTPVCERCGSRAMAALNLLLATDTHRHRGTDAVTVWWTREQTDNFLEALDSPTEEDVAALLAALNACPDPVAAARLEPGSYYALTLALNNARAVVLDWLDIPIGRLRNHLGAWFEDHRVYDGWEDKYRYLPLWHLAMSTGRWDEKANRYVARSAPKGLENELLHAAFTRGPLPARVLPHLLQRIRADRRIDRPRIALLRLALHPNRKDYQVTGPAPYLSITSQQPGYLCGRAFAILEAIQHKALPDIKATIRDQYFGTAMTAPAAVLTNLRNGANGHLKRLRRDKPGTYYALEVRLSDAFAALMQLDEGIPVLLDTRQKAWFVLGYDQQRAADNAARAAHRRAQEENGGGEDSGPDEPESE